MAFDDTLTDEDFRKALLDSHAEWFGAERRTEPDLAVEGLDAPLLTRLLALFGARTS